MPRREFFAIGDTSIAAAALGAANPLRAAQRVGLKAAFVARPFERGPGRAGDTSPEPKFDYWAADFEDLAE